MKRHYYLTFVVIITLMTLCVFLKAAAWAQKAAPLKIEFGAICQNVVNHEVVDAGTSFPATVTKLYCFTKIVGAKGSTEISHVWYYGDIERAYVPLAINSPSWRTYSSKIIQAHEIGEWRVDVLNQEGELLETFRFDIVQQ
ncbi:MAG: DUF2914 domain-containing protein [Deltaproteobacteria bacterium]|nr:DUF2914 domain-containing protein [Deltaproteobacteria bacterium]